MFFHVSYHDHGEYFQFTPKVPVDAVSSKEGNIPRVCVSTSIYNCLHSLANVIKLYSYDVILKCKHDKDTPCIIQPVIYKVVEGQTPYIPPNAVDFRLRDEHWFITPVFMERVGCLDVIELTNGNIVVNGKIELLDVNDISGHGKDVLISGKKKAKYRHEDGKLVDLMLFLNGDVFHG